MVDWQYHNIWVNSADKHHLMTSHDSMLKMQHRPAVSLLVLCRAKKGKIKGLIWKCILSWCSYYTTCCGIGCSADKFSGYIFEEIVFVLVDWQKLLPIFFPGHLDLCGNSRSLDASTCLPFCASLILQTMLIVAFPNCIYSCGSWRFLAFHEWQQMHRSLLPKNLSKCWSHHVNYSCYIQYDHRCLFGVWIMTITRHRWQAPKYLWFCASSKFTFVWQCWGFPCIFMHEEICHVWVRSSLIRNDHLGYDSCCRLVWCCFIT